MKEVWILNFILFLVFILPQVSFSRDPVRRYIFYSEETGGLKLEEEIINPLSEKYPVEVPRNHEGAVSMVGVTKTKGM